MNFTNFTDAIAAVNKTQTALATIDAAQASASAGLAAAQAAKVQADSDEVTGSQAANDAIDAAVVAMTSLKRPIAAASSTVSGNSLTFTASSLAANS